MLGVSLGPVTQERKDSGGESPALEGALLWSRALSSTSVVPFRPEVLGAHDALSAPYPHAALRSHS